MQVANVCSYKLGLNSILVRTRLVFAWTVTYTYHCCAFESFSPSDWHKPSNPYVPPIIELPSRVSDIEHEPTTSPDTKGTNASHVCKFYRKLYITGFCDIDESYK